MVEKWDANDDDSGWGDDVIMEDYSKDFVQ